MKAIALLLLLTPPLAALAQRSNAELPAAARAFGLELQLPSLAGLHFDTATSAAPDTGYARYDLRWRYRGPGPDFELRYAFTPDSSVRGGAPALRAGATATSCARNGDDYVIGRFRGGTDDLARLGAEWAYFWAYAPRPGFSRRRYCYQTSFYHADHGLVTGWLLYDDESLIHSDWAYALRFAAPARPVPSERPAAPAGHN